VITPPTDLLPIFDFQTATIQIVIASVSEAIHVAAQERMDCFRLRSLSFDGRGRRLRSLAQTLRVCRRQ